jgi:hypothetical protein
MLDSWAAYTGSAGSASASSSSARVKMPSNKFAILPVRFPQSHNGYVERRAQTKEVDAYNPNELVNSHLA